MIPGAYRSHSPRRAVHAPPFAHISEAWQPACVTAHAPSTIAQNPAFRHHKELAQSAALPGPHAPSRTTHPP